jgi:hypothetical protein
MNLFALIDYKGLVVDGVSQGRTLHWLEAGSWPID